MGTGDELTDNANLEKERKQRQILHEGTAKGYPLTERQRRYMGARASGYPELRNPRRRAPLSAAEEFLCDKIKELQQLLDEMASDVYDGDVPADAVLAATRDIRRALKIMRGVYGAEE